MPDWSYQPFFRPLLFQLPPKLARDLALGAMGTLGRLPLGTHVIDLMGHMMPAPTLHCEVAGLSLSSPIGLEAGLDPNALALPAFARFGFGFIEVGPVSQHSIGEDNTKIKRQPVEQALLYPKPSANAGVNLIAQRLAAFRKSQPHSKVKIGIRLATVEPPQAATEHTQIIQELRPLADFFTLPLFDSPEWLPYLQTVVTHAKNCPVFLVVPIGFELEVADEIINQALACGIAGVFMAGGVTAPEGYQVGKLNRQAALQTIRYLRQTWGEKLIIVGSGGVHSPDDALKFQAAGANLISLHSGLVYAGPGLAKRINEALIYFQPADPELTPKPTNSKWVKQPAWVFAALLGLALVIGGILTWLVAATFTILSYDEEYLQLGRNALPAINARLLPFLQHDRISLAGTMLSLGLLYAQLAIFGIRRGVAWTRHVLIISATAGNASFFLFLGFGYFDKLHALVSFYLLPFFLLGVRSLPKINSRPPLPNLKNDKRWLLGLYGQFLFVAIGFGLIFTGALITFFGITSVFVAEDLTFMQTNAQTLWNANPNLVPLIAHDRAGFGGVIITNGLAVLFIALWGFREGNRWVWWALLTSGTPAFVATLFTHINVGYTDFWHLAPVLAGFVAFIPALVLSYPYLCMPANRAYKPSYEVSSSAAIGT